MLEHAVAEAVPADVGRSTAPGQRRRRPELTGFLVAQIERFAAGVAHRVVFPRRQAEFVGVLGPGIGLAAFRNDAAELRVGQHVDPRRRGQLIRCGGDDVLASIRREAAQAVGQDQLALRQVEGGGQFGAWRLLRQPWQAHRRRQGAVELFRQRAAVVAQNDAGDSLEQGAVFLGNLFRRTDENAARPVDRLAFQAHRDQAEDLVLQGLAITGAILVPDHQIDHQPLQPPVGVRLNQLAHQFDVGQVADMQQHDGQIAGNGIAPEAGLAAPVLQQDAAVGAQAGMRVENRIRQTAVKLGVDLVRVDLAQQYLGMRPGQLEDTVGETAILIFLDQVQRHLAVVADAVNQIDAGRLFRL